MISYQVYKVIHLTGIALILLGLGTVLGTYASTQKPTASLRMVAFIGHGLGMLLALVGGFGMAARLGLTAGLPLWIYLKLAIWLLLGLGISLAKRKAQLPLVVTAIFAVLVGAAAAIAIWKPGMATSTIAPVETTSPESSTH